VLLCASRLPASLRNGFMQKNTGFGCYFHDIFMIRIENGKKRPKDDREPLSFRLIV
jgi:hypothetical protein